jgi:hypothetical protein
VILPGLVKGVDALTARKPKAFYPQALVGLTAFMETMRPLEEQEKHVFFDGAELSLQDCVSLPTVKPMAVRVLRNSYNKPDSFHIEFDAKSLPINPKQLRACGVDIYLWAASTPNAPAPVDAAGNLLLQPVLSGLVDDVATRYDGEGNVVELDGQDYTALFSQRSWDQKRRVPSGLRLDLQLEQLMREADKGATLRLRVEPESLRAELPVVGSAYRRVNKKGTPMKEKASWWDAMYRMAQQHSFILFVDGHDVVLTRPQVLHDSRAGLRPGDSPPRPIYRFAWGRNLASLELQRHMGKEINPTIEVRSYDERVRRTISARYPARSEKAPTGVGTDREQVQVYTLHGVTSEAVLRQTARTVYELIAKGEQSVTIRTRDLVDLLGADVMQMRTGDAAALLIDFFRPEALENLPEAVRCARLIAAGLPEGAARYIAHNYDVVDALKGPFRVREVTFDYSVTDGIDVTATLQQFVKVPTEAV